jgi:hypothetical protein
MTTATLKAEWDRIRSLSTPYSEMTPIQHAGYLITMMGSLENAVDHAAKMTPNETSRSHWEEVRGCLANVSD